MGARRMVGGCWEDARSILPTNEITATLGPKCDAIHALNKIANISNFSKLAMSSCSPHIPTLATPHTLCAPGDRFCKPSHSRHARCSKFATPHPKHLSGCSQEPPRSLPRSSEPELSQEPSLLSKQASKQRTKCKAKRSHAKQITAKSKQAKPHQA